MRLWFWLLVVLVAGGLGSLSLAPHLLAFEPLAGGECSTLSSSITYISQDDQQAVSPAWLNAGRDEQDLANAQACAASFVISYQTFDSNFPKTLEACTTLLTADAQDRFYGRAPGLAADTHMDAQWRTLSQQEQQTAKVALPALLDSRYVNGRFVVWMKVPYQLFVQHYTQRSFQQGVFTVLLVAVPAGIYHQGTGWQVAAWQEGGKIFTPLTPL